jgi:multisubunit Na+/H+ antiporter MnhE subunit
VLVYALTLRSFKPLDLLLGAIVGSIVLVAFRGFLFTQPVAGTGGLARRAVHLPMFLLVVAREVVVGTWRVAMAVLSRSRRRRIERRDLADARRARRRPGLGPAHHARPRPRGR